MSESLDDRLARIGAEAEAGEVDQTVRPLPAHVKVSRPNRARSKVLQVRLNPDEMEALEAIAARRNLPVSTVAREQLLRLVTEDRAGGGFSFAGVADKLMELAESLRDQAAGAPMRVVTIDDGAHTRS